MVRRTIAAGELVSLFSVMLIGLCDAERCIGQTSPADSVSLQGIVSTDLADFVRLFQTDYESVTRFYSQPYSDLRLERQAAEIARWQEYLKQLDFDSLSQQGRIDYLLMRNHLESEAAGQVLMRQRIAEMDPIIPFRLAICRLEEGRWRTEQVAGKDAAAALAEIKAAVEAGKRTAEEWRTTEGDVAARLTPVLANRTAGAIDTLNRALRGWFEFHDGFEPEFGWWARQPFEEAQKALSEYSGWLRREVAGTRGGGDDPMVGDPIGREALLADLREEMIVYSPEELIAIGESEYAWCESEMVKAAAEIGFNDWKAALAEVKTRTVPPGEMDDLVKQQGEDAIRFLKERDLVSIPPLCEETWRLTMSSPETMRVLPYSAYMGQAVLVSYPTDEMPHEDKMMIMRGNNRHFSRIVVPHELIPGHHLQGFMDERVRPYRGRFSTPFFVEGWALHWEMLLWDLGYPQSPEDRIGMLFWRIHRAARIIVSLKFHLGQMQPQEMIDFLVEKVGHERLGATSEVRRYIGGDYSPLYQCGYMIGGLQIRSMHRELVGTGKMTDRQFHDQLLTYGPIPIELVRAGMTGATLAPQTVSSWRFADR